MDQELEARMRDLRAEGGGAFEKVRLLAALERTGRSDQAWDVGLGFVAARQDRGGEVRERLVELAGREPALVVSRMRAARPALAREAVELLYTFSVERPLVALALGEETPRKLRQLVLTVVERRLETLRFPSLRVGRYYHEPEISTRRVWSVRQCRVLLAIPWLLRLAESAAGGPVGQLALEAYRELAGAPPPFDEKSFLAAR